MRSGRALRIPQQTSLLLTILLERAGSLVTREEIQRLLWSDSQFIDHDHAIHKAVNGLRAALRDSAQNPKYVETFPKRGYSFKAQVEIVTEENPLPRDVVIPIDVKASSRASEELSSTEGTTTALPETSPATASVGPLELGEPASAAESPAPGVPRRLATWAVTGVALLLAIGFGVATLMRRTHRAIPVHAISLGIAPIEAHDLHAQQLGESFRLDLMDTLSQLPNVDLLASHSLENVKPDDASIRELSKNLNLDLLLLGSLAVQNGHCLLRFELIRGRDAVHIASFQYAGTEDELASIRDKVQRDVFANLNVTRKSIQAVRGSTENPQAYGYYLQAKQLAYHRTSESLKASIQQYRLAIDRDPAFARAYAGLATAYLGSYDYTGLAEDQHDAELAAQHALKLDPDLAEAHAAIGLLAFLRDWDFNSAERELERALELDPHEAANHAWLAQVLVIEGRFDESLQQIELAKADDPLWPQVYNIETVVDGGARAYDRAIRAAQRYQELVPGSPNARDQVAWSYFTADRYEDAIAEWRIMASVEKDEWRVALEDRGLKALRRGGIPAYAAVRLEAAKKNPDHTASHSNDFVPAEWEAFIGDNKAAIDELEKEVAAHNDDALDVAINPMFDGLHSDPRYTALLTRAGLKLPPSYPLSKR